MLLTYHSTFVETSLNMLETSDFSTTYENIHLLAKTNHLTIDGYLTIDIMPKRTSHLLTGRRILILHDHFSHHNNEESQFESGPDVLTRSNHLLNSFRVDGEKNTYSNFVKVTDTTKVRIPL